MKRPPKHVCQRLHAKRRAWQRFRLRLTTEALEEIGRMIARGELQLVLRRSRGVTIWRMRVDDGGRTCRVVYDGRSHTVVTFLHDKPPPKRRPLLPPYVSMALPAASEVRAS